MGRQKRKEYAFYAVLAGTFLLIAGAYGSGEKSVQQNAKEMGAVAEKAVAEPEYQTVCRDFYKIRRGRVCRDRKK